MKKNEKLSLLIAAASLFTASAVTFYAIYKTQKDLEALAASLNQNDPENTIEEEEHQLETIVLEDEPQENSCECCCEEAEACADTTEE